ARSPSASGTSSPASSSTPMRSAPPGIGLRRGRSSSPMPSGWHRPNRATRPSSRRRLRRAAARSVVGRPTDILHDMKRRALLAVSLALGVIGLAAPAAADDHAVARVELTGVIDQVNAVYVE